MKLAKIEVNNFRILEKVNLSLDDNLTLIVGRNNSGKTSLTEIFHKFLGPDGSHFLFEDFSISAYANFKQAIEKYKEYVNAKAKNESEKVIEQKELDYKALVPRIELKLQIEYEESDMLASLSNGVLRDLDDSRKDVSIVCEYSVRDSETLFQAFTIDASKYENSIIEFLRSNHKTYYRVRILAVNVQDPSDFREITPKDVENIFLSSFIYAQNQLDDQSIDKSRTLSKGFADYYRLNSEANSDIEEIENALLAVSKVLDGKYESLFAGIHLDLKRFGVNEGVNLQKLKIKANFEAEKILKGNTQLFYDHDENLLPEGHNGLGYSNLIFTMLRLISFYEEFDKRTPKSAFQLIFVEEPEAHLHPQMQHVFIRNIRRFIEKKVGWKAQVIITTHSSHVVSESDFDTIRYFDISDKSLTVKNLAEFDSEQSKKTPETIKFLKQYMTLSRCDMFFADKIIMIEGSVERLLLPEFIKRDCPGLLSQYISVIEVGGAYAHHFRKFVEFINVKTLVITDIDSIDLNDNRKACEVAKEGACTCNQTLKSWLPGEETIEALLSDTKPPTKTQGKVSVAYQVPRGSGEKCGRSFEEAFILANAKVFAANSKDISVKELFQNGDVNKNEEEIKAESYELAAKIKKTDFAFDILALKNWETPKYIKDGLIWLQD